MAAGLFSGGSGILSAKIYSTIYFDKENIAVPTCIV